MGGYIQPTEYYKPKSEGNASIIVIKNSGSPKVYPLKFFTTLGRDFEGATSDIRIKSSIVSAHHGEFFYEETHGVFYYIDKNSTNGTYINNVKLRPFNNNSSEAVKLCDGDVLRIDSFENGKLCSHPESVLILFTTSISETEAWTCFRTDGYDVITIGRSIENVIKLPDFRVSAKHAAIQRTVDGGWAVADIGSTNGVILNNAEIEKVSPLQNFDIIRICDTALVFTGDRIFYNTIRHDTCSLSVNIVSRTVNFGTKTLLRDIKADFSGGDFVLILGGSGAGKTTLIKSMLGEDRADGKIVLDGVDLYKNFRSVKSLIGKVPQTLTLRKNDTLRDTLLDSASMKLGGKYSKTEIQNRVDSVLDHVGISEHQYKLIGQLSGGQQKKAAVANQLVGFQRVFICDEPDSGLDAASRMQQMEILKDISKEDKIVMVITHQPDDASAIENGIRKTLFTKALVLARSSADGAGRVAFFGKIEDVYSYFGVSNLQDIMIEINPPSEGGKGLADYYINKYKTTKRG